MTEQAMLEALRSSQPPAAAERFLEAVRVIDAVEGQLRFDQDGRLIALNLSRDRTSIDAGQLHALAVFPHVRRLRLAGSNLGNAQLRWIAERWNALQELGLHHAGIDDEGLHMLDQFEGLSVLSLRALAGLSDAGLETIAGLPQLEQLFLVDNRITGRGLASLVALTRLQVLDIRGCTAIAADDLRPLADLPRLRVLRLGGPRICDDALLVLRDFPALQSLTVEQAPISDQGLTNLTKLALTEFNLAHCDQVTDEGIQVLLEELDGLHHLALRDVSIRGAFLSALRGRMRLETLRLNETFVDDRALQYLGGAEALVRLELRQGQIGEAGTELLGTLSGLEHLDLAENRLTDAAVEHLSNLKHLRFLDISGNPRVSDEAVQALGRMTALRELKIARTEISPAGLAHLRQQLPDIHITHDALGASGVP